MGCVVSTIGLWDDFYVVVGGDGMRDIRERTSFLRAVTVESSEIDDVCGWVLENPDDAAAYILWLESALSGNPYVSGVSEEG